MRVFRVWWLFPLLTARLCGAAAASPADLDRPFLESELIFPLEHWHNHASCIVECPDGSLLVCWYHGSGERSADDVVVLGSRRQKGAGRWAAPFLMADTPGYPDTNPAMFIDPQKRLWLLWATILANRWETALLKCRTSPDYQKPGPPRWDTSEVLHVTPGTNFQKVVGAALDELARHPLSGGDTVGGGKWIQLIRARAADKLFCRLGWMPRAHPCVLEGRRLIVPLYSDGFDFSLMAISDDWGRSWVTSTPLVGLGNIQPSLALKRDGTLVAFMRDNGPAPHRLQLSQSIDRGETWSPVVDTDRPNPGAGVEVLVLRDGLWLLINNDLETARHSLAVSLSADEGKTWNWTRHLERDSAGEIKAGAGAYHYPSVIQAGDGTLHVSYSFRQKKSATRPDREGRPASESIKHAHFNEAWIRQGD